MSRASDAGKPAGPWAEREARLYHRQYSSGLPQHYGGGKRIQWLWTATGEKLLRTTLDSQGATETKRYAGGFTYRDADGTGSSAEALDHLGHAGGRVRYYESGDQLAYQYAFSDHLGNTRVLAEPDGQGGVQTSEAVPPPTKSFTTEKSSPTVTT